LHKQIRLVPVGSDDGVQLLVLGGVQVELAHGGRGDAGHGLDQLVEVRRCECFTAGADLIDAADYCVVGGADDANVDLGLGITAQPDLIDFDAVGEFQHIDVAGLGAAVAVQVTTRFTVEQIRVGTIAAIGNVDTGDLGVKVELQRATPRHADGAGAVWGVSPQILTIEGAVDAGRCATVVLVIGGFDDIAIGAHRLIPHTHH
jgi:hypothetical protein